ncbi:MAG: helix-turn-helix domain-containing protein, partial [Betaproteobacteria bacterium]|nr:helix-turn-helix domain-containing protein [Betaproteobacteria bacterium]
MTVERVDFRLLSEPEAAAALGVSRWTLERIRKRGEIRARKIGGRWKYRSEWIEDYIEAGSCQGEKRSDSVKSVETGSRSGPPHRYGIERGSTTKHDKPA